MRQVTSQQIIDLLPIVKDRHWSINVGMIRDEDGYCPICAIAVEILGSDKTRAMMPMDFTEALRLMGVQGSVGEFVYAADESFMDRPKVRKLRRQILRALELEVAA